MASILLPSIGLINAGDGFAAYLTLPSTFRPSKGKLKILSRETTLNSNRSFSFSDSVMVFVSRFIFCTYIGLPKLSPKPFF